MKNLAVFAALAIIACGILLWATISSSGPTAAECRAEAQAIIPQGMETSTDWGTREERATVQAAVLDLADKCEGTDGALARVLREIAQRSISIEKHAYEGSD